jgi:hypothetical protein
LEEHLRRSKTRRVTENFNVIGQAVDDDGASDQEGSNDD